MPGSAGRHHCSLLHLTAGSRDRSDDCASRPALFRTVVRELRQRRRKLRVERRLLRGEQRDQRGVRRARDRRGLRRAARRSRPAQHVSMELRIRKRFQVLAPGSSLRRRVAYSLALVRIILVPVIVLAVYYLFQIKL